MDFDATGLISEIYFYRIEAGDHASSSGQGLVDTKKIILLRLAKVNTGGEVLLK